MTSSSPPPPTIVTPDTARFQHLNNQRWLLLDDAVELMQAVPYPSEKRYEKDKSGAIQKVSKQLHKWIEQTQQPQGRYLLIVDGKLYLSAVAYYWACSIMTEWLQRDKYNKHRVAHYFVGIPRASEELFGVKFASYAKEFALDGETELPHQKVRLPSQSAASLTPTSSAKKRKLDTSGQSAATAQVRAAEHVTSSSSSTSQAPAAQRQQSVKKTARKSMSSSNSKPTAPARMSTAAKHEPKFVHTLPDSATDSEDETTFFEALHADTANKSSAMSSVESAAATVRNVAQHVSATQPAATPSQTSTAAKRRVSSQTPTPPVQQQQQQQPPPSRSTVHTTPTVSTSTARHQQPPIDSITALCPAATFRSSTVDNGISVNIPIRLLADRLNSTAKSNPMKHSITFSTDVVVEEPRITTYTADGITLHRTVQLRRKQLDELYLPRHITSNGVRATIGDGDVTFVLQVDPKALPATNTNNAPALTSSTVVARLEDNAEFLGPEQHIMQQLRTEKEAHQKTREQLAALELQHKQLQEVHDERKKSQSAETSNAQLIETTKQQLQQHLNVLQQQLTQSQQNLAEQQLQTKQLLEQNSKMSEKMLQMLTDTNKLTHTINDALPLATMIKRPVSLNGSGSSASSRSPLSAPVHSSQSSSQRSVHTPLRQPFAVDSPPLSQASSSTPPLPALMHHTTIDLTNTLLTQPAPPAQRNGTRLPHSSSHSYSQSIQSKEIPQLPSIRSA